MLKPTKINYLLAFLIPLIVAIIAYESGIDFLLSKWLDFDHGAYNHGFLLLLVTLYLLYDTINFSRDISTKANVIGFVAAALFMVLAAAFEAVSIVSLQVVAFYFFMVFLVLAIYGWAVFKKALMPLGLMLFALPIWDGLGPILQRLTLEMSYLMVKTVGIPVLKEGFYLSIPAGKFEVAAGCSGFSYFMAAFPLAILYAATNFSRRKNIFLVVSVIVAASIVANWLRVFIIIVAGQMTDMQHYFVTVEHFNLGWVLFGIMFISLIFIFKRLLHEGGAVAAFDKEGRVEVSPKEISGKHASLFSMLLAVIGITFLGLQYQMSVVGKGASVESVAANTLIPNYFNPASPLYALDPKVDGAVESVYVTNEYAPPVQLYRLSLSRQKQGQEIVSSGNRLFDDKKWCLINEKIVQNGGAHEIELRSTVTGEGFLLWSWYAVNDKFTASDMTAKWYELMGYVRGDNSGEIIILFAKKGGATKNNLARAYRDIVNQ